MSLNSTSSNSLPLPKQKQPKEKKISLKPSSSIPPLGKFLASSEKAVRDKAVSTLSRFLAGTKKIKDENEVLEVGDLDWDTTTGEGEEEYKVDSRLEPLEMAKLWKGIFYCFWMSDKPLVQQSLATSLALLILDVRPKMGKGRKTGRVQRFRSALAYIKGFWQAVGREWGGLDRLRLDKFYLLIRRFIHVSFLLLKREEFDPRAIEEYNQVLLGQGGPLSILDSKIPHSLAYHLADIYTDELESSLSTPLCTFPSPPSTSTASTSTSTTSTPVILLLNPFFKLLSIAENKVMFARVLEGVFEPLLDCTVEALPTPDAKRRKLASGSSSSSKPQFEGIVSTSSTSSTSTNATKELTSEQEKVIRTNLGKSLLERLLEEGSNKLTNEVGRRRIYQVWRERSGEEL